MKEEIIKVSKNYNEGLITQREYLDMLIDILIKKWESIKDDSKDDEVNRLALHLDPTE